ncbi:MAG: putative competence protein ComEC [Actinomycetota bacterium]
MSAAYGDQRGRWWQPMSDAQVLCLATVTIVAVWLGASRPAASVTCLIVVAAAITWPSRRDLVLLAVLLAVFGAWSSAHSWSHAVPRTLGPYSGWVVVSSDPSAVGFGSRITLEVDGERFDAMAFGPLRKRLSSCQAGELLEVVGVRRQSSGPWARRAQVRHVVGDFKLDAVGAHQPGGPVARASNRVRAKLRSAAARAMPADQAALFTGLIIGDDAAQPTAMVAQFRSAGLSHLTAVSGQNVAFVLAVAGLGLRRLSRWWRLGATLAVIAWFVVVTRVEPSVVRAGMMAGLSAFAFAVGRERHPVRMLSLAVIVLALLDPLLVWSVAFWLSVGATLGVSALATVLAERMTGPRWFIEPLSVSVGAQVGVLVPSWLVFHRLPPLGLAANLLAVPVAGGVMLYGIPAGLFAAALPRTAAVVMAPCVLGTRWVSIVAALVDRFTPRGPAAVIVWAMQLGALWWLVSASRWRRPPSPVER